MGPRGSGQKIRIPGRRSVDDKKSTQIGIPGRRSVDHGTMPTDSGNTQTHDGGNSVSTTKSRRKARPKHNKIQRKGAGERVSYNTRNTYIHSID